MCAQKSRSFRLKMSELSETFTNQGDKGTCMYHTIAKLVVQNIFQVLMPSRVNKSRYQENRCNQFVDDDNFSKDVNKLTPEMCSSGGYDRILQFLYVFHLIEDRLSGKAASTAVIRDILKDLWSEKMPRYFKKSPHLEYVREMVTRVNALRNASETDYQFFKIYLARKRSRKETENELEMMREANETAHVFKDSLFQLLRFCLRKGVYVGFSLSAPRESKHGHHAIHAVGIYNDKIIVKNSWKEGRVHDMSIENPILLKARSAYQLVKIWFILPVTKGFKFEPNKLKLTSLSPIDSVDKLRHLFEKVVKSPLPPKFLLTCPIFHRGDAVMVAEKPGIFMGYMNLYGIVSPGHLVPLRALKPADIRSVPDALEILLKLVKKDGDILNAELDRDPYGKEIETFSRNLQASRNALEQAKDVLDSNASQKKSQSNSGIFKAHRHRAQEEDDEEAEIEAKKLKRNTPPISDDGRSGRRSPGSSDEIRVPALEAKKLPKANQSQTQKKSYSPPEIRRIREYFADPTSKKKSPPQTRKSPPKKQSGLENDPVFIDDDESPPAQKRSPPSRTKKSSPKKQSGLENDPVFIDD